MRHKSNDKRLNEPSALILVCIFFSSRGYCCWRGVHRSQCMFIYLFFFFFRSMIQRKCECLNLETRYDSEKSMSNRTVQHQIFGQMKRVCVSHAQNAHTLSNNHSIEWTVMNFPNFHPFQSILEDHFQIVCFCTRSEDCPLKNSKNYFENPNLINLIEMFFRKTKKLNKKMSLYRKFLKFHL